MKTEVSVFVSCNLSNRSHFFCPCRYDAVILYRVRCQLISPDLVNMFGKMFPASVTENPRKQEVLDAWFSIMPL